MENFRCWSDKHNHRIRLDELHHHDGFWTVNCQETKDAAWHSGNARYFYTALGRRFFSSTPDNTTLAHKSLRMSTSHFMMLWKDVSWIPLASLPMKLGWNKTSGQRKRSVPTVMMLPSGDS